MGLARRLPHEGLALFDDAESKLVAGAMVALSQISPGDAAVLSRLLAQLGAVNRQVLNSQSLRHSEALGGETRSLSTLIDHLCQIDGLCGDLDLPLKATLQRAFLLAKIQFLRAFVKSTTALCGQAPQLAPVNLQLREELAQSIYTQMAEELLLALLRKPGIETKTKRQAASQLITIWDNATLEIDDFCPMLESAWHARNRITPSLGSLLGATECFRLVAEDCSPQFIDFFAREEVSEAENQAFAEFLFGLTWEELSELRTEMRNQGVDAVTEDWAAKVLGRAIEHDHDDVDKARIDPVSLYRSYQRRQLASDFRILAGTKGPRRTAEAYLMIYLLNQQEGGDD